MSLNKVMLIGNVGKDPVIRHNENGSTSANFSVATTEKYKDRNGVLQEQTEWHNIVCWRGMAETVEKYVKKGSQVFIEGKLRYRDWKDQNGQERYSTEILATSINLLGKRAESNGVTPYAQSNNQNSSAPEKEEQGFNPGDDNVEIDDLPF